MINVKTIIQKNLLYLITICHESSYELVPHFIAHYRDWVPLQNMKVVVHGKSNPFFKYNISVRNIYNFTPDLQDKVTNEEIQKLPRKAYFIRTDIDEHFPININWKLGNAYCGRMNDRINVNFTLSKIVPNIPLYNQFELCAPVRKKILHAAQVKVLLAPVTKNNTFAKIVSAHQYRYGNFHLGGWAMKHCTDAGYFSHYSFTYNEIKINMLKQQQQGGSYLRIYSEIRKMMTYNNSQWKLTHEAQQTIKGIMKKC